MTKVVPMQSYTQEHLQSTWSVDGEGFPLIRGPKLSSKLQTAAWLEFLKKFPCASKRWACLQFAMPDVEWPIITSEHFFLEGSWVPHLVFPTPLTFFKKKEDPRSDLQWKTIWKFIQQINCEGWLYYSEWLDDEMEKAIAKFYRDAADEFEVEAKLKDFHHEITSFLLRDYRINCAKLVLQLGQGSLDGIQDRQRDYRLETEIVRMHFEILNNLNIQKEILFKIENSIEKVERSHPELIPLKQAAHLLATLLGPPSSWIQSQLMIGLLNHLLGVGVYINCDTGFDRTNLAFAIQLALKEMLTKYSVSAIAAFSEDYSPNTDMGARFKKLALEYLYEVCLPTTHSNSNWAAWKPDEERLNAFLDAKEQKIL